MLYNLKIYVFINVYIVSLKMWEKVWKKVCFLPAAAARGKNCLQIIKKPLDLWLDLCQRDARVPLFQILHISSLKETENFLVLGGNFTIECSRGIDSFTNFFTWCSQTRTKMEKTSCNSQKSVLAHHWALLMSQTRTKMEEKHLGLLA